MLVRQLTPSVYEIPLGYVNAFLINHDELTLIDTGTDGSTHKLMRAMEKIGRTPSDIRHILVTHCHHDHAGSLAALQKACAATTYLHPVDAALVRQGNALRPLTPAPGLRNKLLYPSFIANSPSHISPRLIRRFRMARSSRLPEASGPFTYRGIAPVSLPFSGHRKKEYCLQRIPPVIS